MVLVFFVYGLAFFSMGFAIALESRQSGGPRLAASLPYLAAFGLLHSLVEWSDMLLLIESASPPTFDMDAVRLVRTLLLGVSTLALVQFGASLLTGDPRSANEPKDKVSPSKPRRHRWLQFLPAVLGLAWLGTLLLLLLFYPLGSRLWLVHADVWARYLLYLPGSLLAGFGLISEAKVLDETEFRQIARDARFAAATFLVNTLVAGLVVPPGQHFPASALNSDTFLSLFGIPVQLLRAASALAIAYFVLRMLRLFRIQSARQVELANQRQIQAQEEALRVQREAQAEMERWNRELEDRIQQRTQEISLRNRQLLAVNSIAASVSRSFDLHEILSQTLQRTLDALDASGGGIFLSGQLGGDATMQLSHGLPDDFVKSISKTRLDAVVVGQLDESKDDRSTSGGSDEQHPRLRSFLVAPLKAKDRVVGVICAARANEPGFGSEDGRLLMAIGHQVGIAVENAHLFAQVQKMAALEERERIAREMHDGLAQVIGFLAIKTRAVQQLLETGQLAQAQSDLAQIHKTVQDTYADVRQSILSLRTATELDRGLIAAIRESASDFAEQNAIAVELALAGEEEVCFPPEAEVQLVRIVQEALANVRKHAKATKVWIRLERRDGEAMLTVEDDGVGFDLKQVERRKRRCFGLETMRERAESIGAHLEVIPVVGQGTKVQVRFPLERYSIETNRVSENPVG